MGRIRTRTLGVLACASACFFSACGGSGTATNANEPVRNEWGDIVTTAESVPNAPPAFDSHAFVRTYASSRIGVFAPIAETEADLSRLVRTTRDPAAKRDVRRKLLVRRFQTALATEDAAARARIVTTMSREERTLLRGNTDAALAAEVAFMHLWLGYVARDYAARAAADAFVRDHTANTDMVRVATLIRGEYAAANHEVANTRTIFEPLRGPANDSLSAFAGYRTATVLCADAQTAACNRVLEEVRVLGCAADASEQSREFSVRAAFELGRSEAPRSERASNAPEHCREADVAASRAPAAP